MFRTLSRGGLGMPRFYFITSAQDRANANENQVTNGDHDRQLDNQDGDAEENLDDTEGNAGGGQYDGNAHRKNENSQKYDSYYSQYVGCFFHLSTPIIPSLASEYAT